MLPTNKALHPQPLPTTTRRTSDAGRPPARKSDGAKCPERRHLRSIVRPGSAPTRTAHRHPRRRVTSSPSQHCLAVSRLTALLPCAGDRDTSAGSCRAVWHASMPTRLVWQSGMLRATVDLDADATIVALDGRNAYTTPVHRRASCARRGRPGPGAVCPPRVRPAAHLLLVGCCVNPTEDPPSSTKVKAVSRATRSPALHALGQHDALVAADERLQPGECLAASLDNTL